jgi:hypothetical protein
MTSHQNICLVMQYRFYGVAKAFYYTKTLDIGGDRRNISKESIILSYILSL